MPKTVAISDPTSGSLNLSASMVDGKLVVRITYTSPEMSFETSFTQGADLPAAALTALQSLGAALIPACKTRWGF